MCSWYHSGTGVGTTEEADRVMWLLLPPLPTLVCCTLMLWDCCQRVADPRHAPPWFEVGGHIRGRMWPVGHRMSIPTLECLFFFIQPIGLRDYHTNTSDFSAAIFPAVPLCSKRTDSCTHKPIHFGLYVPILHEQS